MGSGMKSLRLMLAVLAPTLVVSGAHAASVVFPENGHSYDVVLNSTISWTNAQSAAAASGGHLVTITSASEQSFVQSLLSSMGSPTGSYYFGLHETSTEGVYQPINGESSTYFNWDQGEPNNGAGVPETVASILWTKGAGQPTSFRSGKWNDVPDTGYPDPIVGTPAQADVLRAGYVIESDGSGPVPVPLPPAALAFPAGALVAIVAAKRMRKAY